MKKALFLAILGLVIAFPAFAKAYEPMQLTQDYAVLGVGQSVNFISVNRSKLVVKSNNKAVKANVYGGNQVTLLGVKTGNATVTVCDQNGECAFVYVTVNSKKDAKFYPAKSTVTVGTGGNVTVPTKNGIDIIVLTNSPAMEARLAGNAIKISGLNAGKGTVTVCSSNRGCFPIYVTVKKTAQVLGVKIYNENENLNNFEGLTLSQTNVTVTKDANVNITASMNTGLTAKSNSSVVRTAVNGNVITLYGTYTGEGVVKVCSANNSCVAVNVNVVPRTSGPFQVSPSNLTIEAGKNDWVNTSFGETITASSNNQYVNATVVGSQVFVRVSSLYTSGGSAVLSVCSSRGNCLPVYVTVKKTVVPPTNSGSFRTVTLGVSETKVVPFRTDLLTSFYIVSNSNPQVADASINNNVNTIVGRRAGTATITLCPLAPIYPCGTIGITVVNSVSCSDNSTGPLTLSDNTLSINLQQSVNVTASTCNGLNANSDSSSVGTAVNSNIITIYGMAVGESTVTACNKWASCANVKVKVTDSTTSQPVYYYPNILP